MINAFVAHSKDPETIGTLEVNLMSILDSVIMTAYRYEGSLTRPPYETIVHWNIFNQKITLSSNMLSNLYGINKKCGEGEKEPCFMKDNFMKIVDRPNVEFQCTH